MPATEQTWRDQKVMHIVFAGSALLMTIATVWLLARDHNREWKDWQLVDRKKEAWATRAQRDSLAYQYSEKMRNYEAELRDVQSQPINTELIDQFKLLVSGNNERLEIDVADYSKVDEAVATYNEKVSKVDEIASQLEQAAEESKADLDDRLNTAQDAAIAARDHLFEILRESVAEALRLEKGLVASRKAVAADRTAAVSELGLKVGEGASAEVREKIQSRIDDYTDVFDQYTEEIAEANNYRTDLEGVINEIDAERSALDKERGALQTELARLDEKVFKNTSNPGEWIARWPVLNALYDGNVRIDQIWLPDLTINFNFSQVARFDRCKSCHQAISQTAPGSASEPAYPAIPEEDRQLQISLVKPDEELEEGATLRDVYGLQIAPEGVVNYADVTVHYVLPESPAAVAGLESGDIIQLAGDQEVFEPETVENYLLRQVDAGASGSLTVSRGLDHPLTSHPRLDLYLTDSSPHPEKEMGCTVCHDGQGSGTSFPWTSHTPNNYRETVDWAREHGWFDNHHWIYPMKPARFVESNCLKCHHQKGSLVASEQYPEPPAPKLVHGWTLVEQYGCFGCHEIGGYEGPTVQFGPDLRLEPNYSETASQILRDGGLTDEQRGWAEALVSGPDNDLARRQLLTSLRKDATEEDAQLSAGTHKLAEVLKDVDVAGQYRKAGPSLRFLGAKVEFDWLYSWIQQPSNFRPSTRMPQFFDLHEHLQDPEDAEELAVAERYEPVEIRAMAEYLIANGSDFEYLEPPAEVTEAPSAERGKWLFESRGCLACHSHESFPGIAADQGPDLSRVGAKLNSDKGSKWLYSWVKQPHRYHARTKMPDLYLDPIAETDATGNPTGAVTDPAADIRAFLLSSPADWQAGSFEPGWSPEEAEALADLAQEWLTSDAIPAARAEKFIQEGIPSHLEPRLKADEKLLVGITSENRLDRLQEYVARRSISKHGCFGCHDIPGFESAKPIGASLAEWGRKETSKLAFENIHKFLEGPGDPKAEAHDDHTAHGGEDEHAGHGHLDPGEFDDDTSYFLQALNSHSRDGFIWQKLRMPRSYDYKTTKNKGYNERLRMPKFPINEEEREAIITFVLGLVNEPPADQFLYRPDGRQEAIVEGRQVLDKFNCAGCHTLEMEQWKLAFDEDTFDSQSEVEDFPFLAKHFSEKEVADSLKKDSRGRMHATIHGMPVLSEETGQPQRVDEDGLPMEPDDDESDPYYMFTLWQDTLIGGMPWLRGVQDLMVPADREGYGPSDGQAYPAWGGDLARYLYPRAIAKAQEVNPQVKASEAWGWLPPPLMEEGDKVQTDWLHGFLMDPTPIRPAVIMRMPNFHMSSSDAAKLVDYFAASSGAEFPYEYKPRQRASYLAKLEADAPGRLSDGMNIVVNNNYCVKCHTVAEFMPQGDPTTFGPNLAEVYRRLRPDYVRDWVANPKRILPYTGMPVNIPYPAGIAQDLFHGTSVEQVDGLVDLLMNFDIYTKRQTSVKSLVEAAAAAGGEEAEQAEDEPSAETSDASGNQNSSRR